MEFLYYFRVTGGGRVVGVVEVAWSVGLSVEEVLCYFSISAAMCFWSVWKGEVVNVVEVLTSECFQKWENLRLDPY